MNKNQKWFFPWKTNSSQHQSLHQQGLAWNWPGPALRAHLHHLTREHQRITGQGLWCEKAIGEHRHRTKKHMKPPQTQRTLAIRFLQTKCIWEKMQSNMIPIKDDYKMITVKTSETMHHALRDVWWGRLYQSCPRILGYESCKGPNSFYFDCGLDFVTRPIPSQKVINDWFGIQPQAMPTEINQVEPSISAVLRVGALRRLGGIPCSLGRPPFRKRYERGLCFVLCAWQNGTAVARVIILYLVLVSCRLLS